MRTPNWRFRRRLILSPWWRRLAKPHVIRARHSWHGLTSTPTWSDFHIAADVLETRIANIEPFNMSDALRALYGLYAEGFGKPRWGDKTNHLWNLTVIQDLLPEARFIHIVRDGRDVALSIKDLWWGPSSVAEAAQYWKSGIQKARSQVVGLHHYREIRFEDLVLDTERHLRQAL